jgi:hypothetical protein
MVEWTFIVSHARAAVRENLRHINLLCWRQQVRRACYTNKVFIISPKIGKH